MQRNRKMFYLSYQKTEKNKYYECLDRKPVVFFDYFRKNLDCRSFEPNDAHRKLAEMERKGKLDGVITQNIDGLHQKAGSKERQSWKVRQISYFMKASGM